MIHRGGGINPGQWATEQVVTAVAGQEHRWLGTLLYRGGELAVDLKAAHHLATHPAPLAVSPRTARGAAPAPPVAPVTRVETTVWSPVHGAGPLGETIANTFRGGTYLETVVDEPVVLYRVYGGKASPLGPFWTRIKPTGPLQARLDMALLSEWGNTAEYVVAIRIPPGTTIYEGFAAPQAGNLKPFESLLGGGNQVYIPRVNPEWIIQGTTQ